MYPNVPKSMPLYNVMLTCTYILFPLTPVIPWGNFYMFAHMLILHWFASICHVKCTIYGMFSYMLDIRFFLSLLSTP